MKTKTKAHPKQVSPILPKVEALPTIRSVHDDDVGEQAIEVALDGGPNSKKGVQWPTEWSPEQGWPTNAALEDACIRLGKPKKASSK